MNETDSAERSKQNADAIRGWSPARWSTIYGAIAAISYTAANVCLRTVTDQDPVWVSCVKAFPTLVGTSLCLFLWRRPKESLFPPRRVIGLLVMAALVGQLGGNVAFQWGLGQIGIALTVPLCMGGLIIGSAMLGRIFLNEPLTSLTLTALAALVAAIWILSVGARGAASVSALVEVETTWIAALGVGAGCLAGVSYAVLGVAIRSAVIGQASVAAATFCVSATGVACLGPASVALLGWEQLFETPPTVFAIMMLAGVFNLIAFLALARALQIATLTYVNALNASQVAMASLAGVLFFREQPSSALVIGAGLTMAGLLLMPRSGRRDPDESLVDA